MRKTAWNTYRIMGYSHDVANDQRSAGGVHAHEVRKTASGWQKRIRQSNGRFTSYGPTEAVSDADGESMFAEAQCR